MYKIMQGRKVILNLVMLTIAREEIQDNSNYIQYDKKAIAKYESNHQSKLNIEEIKNVD